MQTCRNCFRHIDDDIAYCPNFGNRVYVTPVPPVPVTEHPAPPRKPISKKKLAIIIIACILLVAQSVGIVVCETRIYQAKQLYDQGEYSDAYKLVREIPVLGRESLIRIKAAWDAGRSYESYLIVYLHDDGDIYVAAYDDALLELVSGLSHIKRMLDRGELNSIEQDEYEKFSKLIYEELQREFHMSKTEVDNLVSVYQEASTYDQIREVINTWLEENFY